jgi:hypothetical protein
MTRRPDAYGLRAYRPTVRPTWQPHSVMCVSVNKKMAPSGDSRTRPIERVRDGYLLATIVARRYTDSDFMPLAVAGLLTFSSSPVTLTVRFPSVPAWFGNIPPT